MSRRTNDGWLREMNNLALRFLAVVAVLSAATVLGPFVGSPEAKPSASLASGGLDGSLGAGMQPVDLPARVSRVAAVPGSGGGEAWATGHMTAAHPEWSDEQTVFLHYRRGEGWSIYGPPRNSAGSIEKFLALSQMSFTSSGEGWAVGAMGALVHYTPGTGWSYQSACDPGGPLNDACADLYGVSVVSDGDKTVGFAVGTSRRSGSANTILRYDGTSWAADPAILVADPNPVIDLVSVATVNANEAWAIGGTSSRELQIFHRIGNVWQRSRTQKPIFDNPAPSNDGRTVNLSANGFAVAVTPDGSTVWVGGGIYPVDPGEPISQADAPFTLRLTSSSGWHSFCPRQYSLHNDNASAIDICDSPMPLSPFELSSLSVISENEVFAGGLGLFHYRGGTWWREPNSNGYLSSISFSSASEGWVASSGNKIGARGMASTSASTLGHYISRSARETPHTARWPHFNRSTLYGAANSPSGSQVIAVGSDGIALSYKPGLGWDKVPGFAGVARLHAVAWSDSNRAWAVGDKGVVAVVERGQLDIHPASSLTRSSLNSLTFSRGKGFAVGDRGTILSYSEGGWKTDPKSGTLGVHLNDVIAYGSGFVAVGDNGTVLVNASGSPGDWSRDDSLDSLMAALPSGRRAPLYVASAINETLVVAGGSKLVAVKRPGESFQLLSSSDGRGSILDLVAISTNRGLEVFAIFSESNERFRARRTTLMHFDVSKWRDLDLAARRTTYQTTDIGGIPDPVFGLVVDPSGRGGWAVGGTVPLVSDELGNYDSEQTSAIYRFDLDRSPSPSGTTALIRVPQSGFNFAFFSESSCGTGYCSIAVGSGTRADEVALEIRDQINRASRQPNGPKFVIFGGNMRGAGLPEEVEQFRGYLTEFEIPVFAALGPQDLFKSGAGSQAQSFLPELPDDDLERAGLKPPDLSNAVGSNRFYLRAFANEWAPWGTGGSAKRSSIIRPVDNIGLPATNGLARTHYAFDYAPGGRPVARFVVLDTSDFLFSKQAQSANQNPQNQDQASWLSLVVSDAKDPTKHNPPLPVLVAMNVPTVNPLKAVGETTLADGKGFETAAVGYGLSAVLTGFVRANATYSVPTSGTPGSVPIYLLGGGGAPPARTSSKYPNDGHYHSWALVNVDTKGVSLLNPQATVSVSPIPVIESLALHAVDGLTVEGGWTLQFQALARAITGGAVPGDPQQNRMSYLSFPTSGRCFAEGLSQGGFCLNQSAKPPTYYFESENPDVADFVKPGGMFRHPALENGALILNDQLGFLCTFKVGTAWIKIIAGGKQVRVPVTVTPGFGPCVDKPVLSPPKVPVILAPEIVPEAAIRQPFLRPPTFPDPFVLALPPVPAPIPAPAPPASAAGARKEEEEAQYEEQSDEGENQAVVLSYERRNSSNDPVFGWLSIAAASSAGLLMALATATAMAARRRRTIPRAIYVEVRTE